MVLSTGSVSVVCAGIRRQPPGVITLKVTTWSIHFASVLKIFKKCKRKTVSSLVSSSPSLPSLRTTEVLQTSL